jgi:hypothetical protein
VQRQIFVVVHLLFQQQKDHAHGHDVLGQVPDLALHVYFGEIRGHERTHDEDRGPAGEARNRHKSAGRGPAEAIPEVQTASEVDGEDNGIECQIRPVGRPLLNHQQKHHECPVQDRQRPAQGMAEATAQADQSDRQRRRADEHRSRCQRPDRVGNGVHQTDVKRVGSQQQCQHPAAGGLAAVRHTGPHEEDAGPGQRVEADRRCQRAPGARQGVEQEGREMEADHQPADQPQARSRSQPAPRYRPERQGQKRHRAHVRQCAPVHQAAHRPVWKSSERLLPTAADCDSSFVAIVKNQRWRFYLSTFTFAPFGIFSSKVSSFTG